MFGFLQTGRGAGRLAAALDDAVDVKAGLAVVAAVGGVRIERVDDSRVIADLADKTFLAAEHTGQHVLLGQTDRFLEVDEQRAGLYLRAREWRISFSGEQPAPTGAAYLLQVVERVEMDVLEEVLAWPNLLAQVERHALLAGEQVGVQVEELRSQLQALFHAGVVLVEQRIGEFDVDQRFVLDQVQFVLVFATDRVPTEIPVMNHARRYDRLVVLVAVQTVVQAVVLAQTRPAVDHADRTRAAVALVVLPVQADLDLNLEELGQETLRRLVAVI